jgi:D-alanine-D-alanine ligase
MRIAVLFGGISEERDVSVTSGAQVVQALETAGHDVVAIDTARGVLGPAEREQLLAAGGALTQPSSDDLSLVRRDAASLVSRLSETPTHDA